MRPRIVLAFGTFDILHAGHFHFFRDAKKLGDRLVIVLARDATVKKVKGHAPFHTEKERRDMLAHIGSIDRVILGDQRDVYMAIRRVRPAVIALGYDQKTFVRGIEAELKKHRIPARVVRLKSYMPVRCKTERIRKHLRI